MLQYLCPNCGGQMVYTSQQNALICDSCGSTFSAGQMRTPNSHETCVSCGSSFEDIPRNVYSGFCESCDSAFVNESLLSAETPPDYMAPFEIDEKDAENLFIEWLSKRRWIPNQLKRDIKISARNKFLMPFYCYDYSGSGDMIFDCVKKYSKEVDGKTETVSDHYDVAVRGNVTIKQYPVDAMNELTDEIVDYLAPFNNDTAVEFYPSQFTGVNSKQQDYTAEEMEDRALNAAAKYSENFLRREIKGFDSVTIKEDRFSYTNTSNCLTYYPLYILNLYYNSNYYVFCMNGQTGKVCGETPISKPKVIIACAIYWITALLLSSCCLIPSLHEESGISINGFIAILTLCIVLFIYFFRKERNKTKGQIKPELMDYVDENNSNAVVYDNQYKYTSNSALIESAKTIIDTAFHKNDDD